MIYLLIASVEASEHGMCYLKSKTYGEHLKSSPNYIFCQRLFYMVIIMGTVFVHVLFILIKTVISCEWDVVFFVYYIGFK